MVIEVVATKEEIEFLERYASRMGKIIANLQGLELLLRAFLQDQPGAEATGFPDGTDFYSQPVGSVVPLCPLTNHDSLETLILKYNRVANSQGGQKIDPSLAKVRDALAHGRISASTGGSAMRLIKYSAAIPPGKKTVKVVFNAVLSEDWFVGQTRAVIDTIQIVRTEAVRLSRMGIMHQPGP